MHDLILGHSALIRHSGRQLGGTPINWLKHEQDGTPLAFLHWEFGPQGEGIHGSVGSAGISAGGADEWN